MWKTNMQLQHEIVKWGQHFEIKFFPVVIRDLKLTPEDMMSAAMWGYILS